MYTSTWTITYIVHYLRYKKENQTEEGKKGITKHTHTNTNTHNTHKHTHTTHTHTTKTTMTCDPKY